MGSDGGVGGIRSMTVLCSVIIPVFSRTAWIGRCIEALKNQQATPFFELVIVDDGSPNAAEMEAIVKAALLDTLIPFQFIRTQNGGPAKARNTGVINTSGEILCFLDDDSVPAANWLYEVMRTFTENPSVAIVSGPALSFDRENPLPLLLERTVYSGKSFATCNIAYRREVFERLGGFDETFREPSWEDNDLGLRARWSGASHVYNEKAVVYHPHEATLEEYRDKCRLNGRGAAAFSCKYLKVKPLWGVLTPIIMARRLLFGLYPSCWSKPKLNKRYVQFLWSYNSLQGFLSVFTGRQYGKN